MQRPSNSYSDIMRFLGDRERASRLTSQRVQSSQSTNYRPYVHRDSLKDYSPKPAKVIVEPSNDIAPGGIDRASRVEERPVQNDNTENEPLISNQVPVHVHVEGDSSIILDHLHHQVTSFLEKNICYRSF